MIGHLQHHDNLTKSVIEDDVSLRKTNDGVHETNHDRHEGRKKLQKPRKLQGVKGIKSPKENCSKPI